MEEHQERQGGHGQETRRRLHEAHPISAAILRRHHHEPFFARKGAWLATVNGRTSGTPRRPRTRNAPASSRSSSDLGGYLTTSSPRTLLRSERRMAGHSKWKNIRNAKAATDKKRAGVFTKLIRSRRLSYDVITTNPSSLGKAHGWPQ